MPNEETTKIILEFPASNVKIELGTTITFDNISGFLDSERVTYNGESLTEEITHLEEGKADTTYVDTELNKKADKSTTYTKSQVDNALNNKMNKSNPTGTGNISVGNSLMNFGTNSQAFGSNHLVTGRNTFVAGEGNEIYNDNAVVFGRYCMSAQYKLEIVGNGTNANNRSNARTLDENGNETLAGDLTFNGGLRLTSEIQRLDNRITDLPEPMVFKGTLGVGGTIQSLPTASAENEGWMFKCITAGTYADLTLKVGDTVTCFNPPNTSTYYWDKTGSQDTDTDTWRNIKVNGVEKLGNGISSGAVDFEDTANVKFEFDANGNKIKAKLDGIYTESEVDDLLDDKADADNTYTKEQVDDIVYNILPDDTASGSVANFATSLELPIKSLEVDVNAVQESGTPTPASPLPISGWSQSKAYQRGVNLWNENTEIGGLDDTTGQPTSDNNRLRSADYCPIKENETVYVKKGGLGNINLFFYDASKTFLSKTGWVSGNATRNIPSGAYYFKIVLATQYGTTYNHDISINYPSSDTEYHAYNPNSQDVTIALGDTYYGGHFTQDKAGHRQFEVTHGIKLASELAFRYSNNSGNWNNYLFFAQIIERSYISTVMCSNYPVVTEPLQTVSDKKMVAPAWGGNNYVYVRDDDYTSVADFISANGNMQIVYELATPYIIDLPDGEPIITLNGTNNIYADTGDSTVVFKCSVNDYINAHSGVGLRSLGNSNENLSKGGSEEEPTEEEPKEVTKTLGDEPISKK